VTVLRLTLPVSGMSKSRGVAELMSGAAFRFEDFLLDTAERRLTRGAASVELNGRYLDALALLVREAGKLVTKDRFLEEVWRGVPVTDEALTQCIRTLRRQLGDQAAEPRFIQTVPKHGYRFVAPVECVGPPPSPAAGTANDSSRSDWHRFLLLAAAGTIGGAFAGLLGGLAYGFAAASQPGVGAASVLLVLTCITVVLAMIGGAGVALGIAAAASKGGPGWHWSALGGALGGLIVGALVKLLGVDAFNLLFGQSPGDITGAAEGALLGGAVGLGAWLGSRGAVRPSLRRGMVAAAIAGGAAGLLIPLLGGRLLGGSLDLLVRQFPNSRIRLDPIGSLVGETGFGPAAAAVTGGLEGLLFGACVVGAMIVARRRIGEG
jgi:DNA-binding winged helix-turn-helix (wHTH) protein